jgi:hypothetical protein
MDKDKQENGISKCLQELQKHGCHTLNKKKVKSQDIESFQQKTK